MNEERKIRYKERQRRVKRERKREIMKERKEYHHNFHYKN